MGVLALGSPLLLNESEDSGPEIDVVRPLHPQSSWSITASWGCLCMSVNEIVCHEDVHSIFFDTH